MPAPGAEGGGGGGEAADSADWRSVEISVLVMFSISMPLLVLVRVELSVFFLVSRFPLSLPSISFPLLSPSLLLPPHRLHSQPPAPLAPLAPSIPPSPRWFHPQPQCLCATCAPALASLISSLLLLLLRTTSRLPSCFFSTVSHLISLLASPNSFTSAVGDNGNLVDFVSKLKEGR